MSDDVVDNPQRRDFVIQTTKAMGVAGCAAACWPLISSMNPTAESRSKGVAEVALSSIPVGETKVVAWQGKPLFVTHRTAEEIEAAQQHPGGLDPEPDAERVKNPEWLVVVGVCTHLGCVPNKSGSGWLCPCHGSVYDESGRVTRGPAPRNLEVPSYEFIDDGNKIRIG